MVRREIRNYLLGILNVQRCNKFVVRYLSSNNPTEPDIRGMQTVKLFPTVVVVVFGIIAPWREFNKPAEGFTKIDVKVELATAVTVK